ncbi:MAG: biotin--[acetyl-CoA-carboxylase] ligase [Candidatus Pelagibacter sp. TMED118]|nr:MAG: biotin--[acetyl-CoA-carboxylase] ligase [Candidatus Pelagibacter sp. TMED118]
MQLKLKDISLNTNWVKAGNSSFIYFDEIGSTLDIALDQKYQSNFVGSIVITDNQTNGRGTYNKSWFCEPFKDLTFSIILGNQYNFSQILVDEVCKSVLLVLKNLGIDGYKKEPNDIYIDGKKIAGILLSNLSSINALPYQAISIGMNINSNLNGIDSSTEAISTSLLQQTGQNHNREDILCKLIESIDKAIQKLIYP